jgi:threonine synthase
MELGAQGFVIPTAGNAGGALAAYAARAGVPAHVFMPADAHIAYQLEVRASGAELHLVDGLIDEAGRQVSQLATASGLHNVATFREPYRVEGKKTMGFELFEDFFGALPDVILYPTGGGTGLVGMYKAFMELRELGWLEGELPRLISVQAEGCSPVVRAITAGADRIEPWQQAQTAAAGLRVPAVFADVEVLAAIRQTGGTAVAVSEMEIEECQHRLARYEGVLACREGAATFAGLLRLMESDLIGKEERVVLFNTATGLKEMA